MSGSLIDLLANMLKGLLPLSIVEAILVLQIMGKAIDRVIW